MTDAKHYWQLLLIACLLFIPGIKQIPVIDRDEAHFAQATRQMLQTGNYFQIRFQNKTRFQKPPGINWLQAASVKVFSNADANQIWPYRIPSLLAAILSVLALYFFASRFIAERAAWIAAALLASCCLVVIEAHMAVIDASLLFTTLLMQGSLWIIYHNASNNKPVGYGWPLCFWLAMTAGFVLKGVTPLFACLTIIALAVVDRRVQWVRALRPVQGLILFLILNFLWLSQVNQAEHSNYLLQMINKDLLPKLQGGHESHGKPPLFHLAILPVTFWPASLFLWPAAIYAWRNRYEKNVKFLLAWLIPSWLFFECMPTKLPQYVMPLFPVLAIFSALAIDGSLRQVIARRCYRLLQVLWTILSIALPAMLLVLIYRVTGHCSVAYLVQFIIIISLIGLTFWSAWQDKNKSAVLTLLAVAVLTWFLLFAQILPAMKPIWLSNNLTAIINPSTVNKTAPLLAAGFEEPSLVFNYNTDLIKFTDSETALANLADHPQHIVLIEEKTLQRSTFNAADYVIKGKLTGFNYSNGHWITLLVIGKQRAGEN